MRFRAFSRRWQAALIGRTWTSLLHMTASRWLARYRIVGGCGWSGIDSGRPPSDSRPRLYNGNDYKAARPRRQNTRPTSAFQHEPFSSMSRDLSESGHFLLNIYPRTYSPLTFPLQENSPFLFTWCRTFPPSTTTIRRSTI